MSDHALAQSLAPMSVIATPEIVLHSLSNRNRIAERVIGGYAKKHAAMDVAIGLAGFIPIPGAAFAALGAAIMAQGPAIYRPMAAELSAVYNAVPALVDDVVKEGLALNAAVDMGGEIVADLLSEILTEVITEAIPGGVLTFVPFIGGIVGAGLDAVIGATLTWRVGTMISIYHQNGGQWIGNRRATYERAKRMVGRLSPQPTNRVNLDEVADSNPEVKRYQMNTVRSLVEMLLTVTKDLNSVRQALNQRNIPADLIETILRELAT